MALLFEEAGYDVVGVDNCAEHVAALNNKTFSSIEKGVNKALRKATHFRASNQIQDVLQENIATLLVIVPTTAPQEAAYTCVATEQVIQQIAAHGARKKPVQFVMISTTPPGYCQKIADTLRPLNYVVTYHPEFIAQGTIMEDLRNPDILLLGQDTQHPAVPLQNTLHDICKNEPTLHRMSLLSAEVAKLSLNCFLTMKIAFVNAVGDLSVHVGAEPNSILNAIADDKRIARRYLRYGHGYGGPCLPRDNQALNKYATQVGVPLHLSTATQIANQEHLRFQKAHYLAKYPPEDTIVFEGITYKPGTNLIEKSQPLALARALAEAGRTVLVKERIEVITQLKKQHPDLFILEEITQTEAVAS